MSNLRFRQMAGKVVEAIDPHIERVAGDPPHVAILMATYNGRAYLSDQLHSILDQDHANWSLWVSDDGSTDGTLQVLQGFQASHPERQINLRRGPGLGSTANFLNLLCDTTIVADFYAISDQDDVWLPEKLTRAVERLLMHDGGPALYGADTIVVKQDLKPVARSLRFSRQPDFRNALVQNISGGNTMVFNRAAHGIAVRAMPRSLPVCHDWWLYQIITGAGGSAIHDDAAMVLYRQHDQNQFGSNRGTRAHLARLIGLLNGRFKTWNAQNIAALASVTPVLSENNRAILDEFSMLRRMKGLRAIRHLHRTGLFRQSLVGNVFLMIAAFLGRL